MGDSEQIWRCIHAQFEFHRQPTDHDAQTAMDRIARKCLGLAERRSFDPTTCSVSEGAISKEALGELVVYHAKLHGYPSIKPIVVLTWSDRNVVIEGNKRVNRWRAANDNGPFPAIFVEVASLFWTRNRAGISG